MKKVCDNEAACGKNWLIACGSKADVWQVSHTLGKDCHAACGGGRNGKGLAAIGVSRREAAAGGEECMECVDTGLGVRDYKVSDRIGVGQPNVVLWELILAKLKVLTCNLESLTSSVSDGSPKLRKRRRRTQRAFSVKSDASYQTLSYCETIPQSNEGENVHVSRSFKASRSVKFNDGAPQCFIGLGSTPDTVNGVSGLVELCREDNISPFSEVLRCGKFYANYCVSSAPPPFLNGDFTSGKECGLRKSFCESTTGENGTPCVMKNVDSGIKGRCAGSPGAAAHIRNYDEGVRLNEPSSVGSNRNPMYQCSPVEKEGDKLTLVPPLCEVVVSLVPTYVNIDLELCASTVMNDYKGPVVLRNTSSDVVRVHRGEKVVSASPLGIFNQKTGSAINLGHLVRTQKETLLFAFEDISEVFLRKGQKLGCTDRISHNAKPLYVRSYRVPQSQDETFKELEEHVQNLKLELGRFRAANLKLKPEKCNFMLNTVNYLGHRTEFAHVDVIKECPTTQTVKEIRQFIGLVGDYRRFIPNFSKTAQPLTELTKKDVDFEWNDVRETAFSELREALCNKPILRYPDFSIPFYVTCDSSGSPMGAVLSRRINGSEQHIYFISRRINEAGRNYSTTERKYLWVYLYVRKYTVLTEQRPLRLARWSLLLSDYDFDIIHKPGKTNDNAATLY
ncbi:hypothetical protein PR048_033046 [Dryococelus australis]|uniref:Reverse transcriptase/retrotransposon-derived protein RNase H-like domain-containing protein n=1 Tax=Dryococelus australis TaxID=614101 RepID=A0ABQ9G1Y6_9NEOP|nr:hypothetical protein PR048_033046 [Dryococelus australis]